MRSGKVLPTPQSMVHLYFDYVLSNDKVLEKDDDLKSDPRELER